MKAITGFSGSEELDTAIAQRAKVVTGNWGCGAFNGNPQCKLLIQWIAASVNNRNAVYCLFSKNQDIEQWRAVIKMYEGKSVRQLLDRINMFTQ